MGIIVPSHQDYIDSAHEVQGFFKRNGLEYCIYGSFLIPQKIRPGLSDIDIFVIENNTSALVSLVITEGFGEIKDSISRLDIPLQINWTTTGQLGNEFLSPDTSYIQEVRRGLGTGHVSSRFTENLELIIPRGLNTDDATMARYFHRKIAGMGEYIGEIRQILQKEEQIITREEQKELWKFWDAFKKLVAYIGVCIRIKTGESLFHLPNRELIMRFASEFGVDPSIFESYIKALESVQNIGDWYGFLQDGGLDKVRSIYTQVFQKVFKTSKF